MTLSKDTFDAWTEAAYEYVRDQIRSNALVGLAAGDGIRVAEVGATTLEELLAHPEDQPSVWISPAADRITRQGNVLEHRIRVDVAVYHVIPLQPRGDRVDGQKRFRQMMGRVYNEVLHLRDAGATAGHWDDWEPSGDLTLSNFATQERAVVGGNLPFTLTRDRIWITEGA